MLKIMLEVEACNYAQYYASIICGSLTTAPACTVIMRDIIIQAYYQQSFIFRITRRAVGVCAYTRNAAAGRATRVGRRAPDSLLHASHSGRSRGKVTMNNL